MHNCVTGYCVCVVCGDRHNMYIRYRYNHISYISSKLSLSLSYIKSCSLIRLISTGDYNYILLYMRSDILFINNHNTQAEI